MNICCHMLTLCVYIIYILLLCLFIILAIMTDNIYLSAKREKIATGFPFKHRCQMYVSLRFEIQSL